MDLNFSKKIDYNRLKIDYVVSIWHDNELYRQNFSQRKSF